MSNFFPEFKHVSKEEWSAQILADLRGKDPSLLEELDLIEELDFSSFYHNSDRKHSETPGSFPYTRGMAKSKNDWKNGVRIPVHNEAEANTKALSVLMTGADLIWFEATNATTDWKRVIEGIQFEHIQTQFSPYSVEDLHSILKITPKGLTTIQFNLDLIGKNDSSSIFSD
jgi:hypothetical protein